MARFLVAILLGGCCVTNLTAGEDELKRVAVDTLLVSVTFPAEGELALSTGEEVLRAGSVGSTVVNQLNSVDDPTATALLAQRILAATAETGALRVLNCVRLVTIENRPAFVQLGRRVPRITGTSVSPRGRANQVTIEDVGMIVKVTPSVENGSILLEVTVERSYMGPPEEGAVLSEETEADEIRIPNVETLSVESTHSASSGRAVLLASAVDTLDERIVETFLVITPRLIE